MPITHLTNQARGGVTISIPNAVNFEFISEVKDKEGSVEAKPML